MKNFITLFSSFVIARLKVVTLIIILCFLTSVTYSQMVSQLPPLSTPPLKLGQSVVTSDEFFGLPTQNVVRVIDTRNIPPFVPGGNHWNAPPQYAGADWTKDRMKAVYGIALDDATSPNIFVSSATSIYFPCVQMATTDSVLIFKLDGATWGVGNYVLRNFSSGPPLTGVNTIPNTGPGMGNLCYEKQHGQIFATNMEDGRIYRIGAGGIVLSTLDPFLPDDLTPGFARVGDRLFGIGSYGTNLSDVKVYFSRWRSDYTNRGLNNEIWSVKLDNAGEFISSTVTLEITLPFLPGSDFSAPVTDIEFSSAGDMLLGERSFDGDCSGAHFSRILEYPRDILGNYVTFFVHRVGLLGFAANSCGGVDYDFGISDSLKNLNDLCDSIIVGTGDYLFNGAGGLVYGVQVTDRSQSQTNPIAFNDFSHFIDLNGAFGTADKRSPGDIDVYRQDLCGDTSCITILSDTIYCDSTGTYIYEFTIKNNSPTKYIEELEIAVDSPLPPNYVVATPSNFIIFPPIPPLGSSGVKRVKLIGPGAVATAEVCFTLSAHFVNDDCPWCCYIENCIKLPICGTCVEVLQDNIYCTSTGYAYNFTLQNGTIYNVSKIQLTSPGSSLTFVPQTFHFGTPIAPGQVFPNLTADILGGSAGMPIPIRIKLFDGTFECCYIEFTDTLPPCDTLHLNLTTFIQGRYNVKTNSMIGDVIEVQLRNTTSPFSIVETATGYLNEAGMCRLNYYYVTNETDYYIVVKHRNSIETWSKSPGQSFSEDILDYDFLVQSQAYGYNLSEIDATLKWYGIFSGDVNQDGTIDASDLSIVENDVMNFVFGYVVTDINGDYFVDASDMSIVDNNGYNFINTVRP